MQKGNDSMTLYLSVDTDIDDLEIDYMEVRLSTGETVMIDWDESDIAREDAGEEYTLEYLLPYVISVEED